MPRRSKTPRKAKVALTPEQKKARRAIRKARREGVEGSAGRDRSSSHTIAPEYANHIDLQFWSGISQRMKAASVIAEERRRPFWLSIPDKGNPPVSGFFPCSMFRREGRWFYGFLFREHRDRCFKNWQLSLRARKELTNESL